MAYLSRPNRRKSIVFSCAATEGKPGPAARCGLGGRKQTSAVHCLSRLLQDMQTVSQLRILIQATMPSVIRDTLARWTISRSGRWLLTELRAHRRARPLARR